MVLTLVLLLHGEHVHPNFVHTYVNYWAARKDILRNLLRCWIFELHFRYNSLKRLFGCLSPPAVFWHVNIIISSQKTGWDKWIMEVLQRKCQFGAMTKFVDSGQWNDQEMVVWGHSSKNFEKFHSQPSRHECGCSCDNIQNLSNPKGSYS